jgi:hypothetical protein
MTLTTLERVSPFSPEFNWDDYTNELYHLSDDYGYLSVEQMREELNHFGMSEYTSGITFSWNVEEFVDYLFDANTD